MKIREWMCMRQNYKTKKLHPATRIEIKLRLLARDVSERDKNSLGILYAETVTSKLYGVKLMCSLCKEAAEEMKAVFQKEKTEEVVLSGVGRSYDRAAAFFDSFLYFTVGTMDVLASITYQIYTKDRQTLTERYFKDQMETFITHPNINPEYSLLLAKNKDWITDVSQNRDALAHKASPFLGFEKDGRVIVDKREPYDDKAPFKKKALRDLVHYLDTTFQYLYVFLEEYVGVHRKIVPTSDRSKMMMDAMGKDLIKAINI